MSFRHERDYIDRTIETVRNHRDADNCWPQWANIFADDIEDHRKALVQERAARNAVEERLLKAYEAHGVAEVFAMCAGMLERSSKNMEDLRITLDELTTVTQPANEEQRAALERGRNYVECKHLRDWESSGPECSCQSPEACAIGLGS